MSQVELLYRDKKQGQKLKQNLGEKVLDEEEISPGVFKLNLNSYLLEYEEKEFILDFYLNEDTPYIVTMNQLDMNAEEKFDYIAYKLQRIKEMDVDYIELPEQDMFALVSRDVSDGDWVIPEIDQLIDGEIILRGMTDVVYHSSPDEYIPLDEISENVNSDNIYLREFYALI